MIKKINTVPNIILHTKAVKCSLNTEASGELLSSIMPTEPAVWSEEVVQLVQDLKDTAESLGDGCLGLASNQIWDKEVPPPAVFVIRMYTDSPREEFIAFINPTVTTSGKTIKHTESCFSRPGIETTVKRERNATVEFSTLSSKGRQSLKVFLKDSFTPIVLQHEYDHLLGKLI